MKAGKKIKLNLNSRFAFELKKNPSKSTHISFAFISQKTEKTFFQFSKRKKGKNKKTNLSYF